MMEEKEGSRGRIPRKDLKRMSVPALWRGFRAFGFHCPSVFKGGRPDSDKSKLVLAPADPNVKCRNPRHVAGAYLHN